MAELTTIDPFAGVLELLQPRQVANDKIDKDAWLRARLSGITATEAKVLHTGSSRDKAEVVRKKLEGDDFTGNQFTEWGSYREAHLLQLAGAREYGWLVHAPGNERHLATPDGLRLTWDGFAVVECKTSKYDISFGSERFNSYGYLWQMLWQMYAAETDEAFYAWELHDDDWSRWKMRPRDDESRWHEFGPQPVASRVEHVVLTPELRAELDKMRAAADRALVRLDKKLAEARAAADPVPLPPEAAAVAAEADRADGLQLAAIETQVKLYRRALDREKAMGEEKQLANAGALELAVKRWGDEAGEHEFVPNAEEPGKVYRIGYSPASTKQTTQVDEDAARAANAELWAKREAARVAYEAVQDQWQAHAANHTKTSTASVAARVTMTEKKGK